MTSTEEIVAGYRDDSDIEREKKKASAQTQKALLGVLSEIGGKLTAEEDVVFHGTKIVLPANSTLGQNIKFLENKLMEEEREMSFSRQYRYRPWDGAHATMSALKKTFGMVSQKEIMTFFGPQPPKLITINTGPDTQEQVPWGAMAIPLLPGVTFYLGGYTDAELGTLFQLAAEGPRKYRFEIEGVFRIIEEELRTNSIYRGKAFDGKEQPGFLSLDGVDPEKVIYSEEVLTQLNANVWSLLQYTDQMRDLDLPLKRAVLFEGPYGTGKTLGAYLTAKVATENGWTFIFVRPGRDSMEQAMATAVLYQPAVVFVEDVDTISDGETAVTRLLDIMDGLSSKNNEVVCVFTTNHRDRIHKGMMRPGRLDAVIHIGALDTPGIRKLAYVTVPRELLSDDIDWEKVGEAMNGFMPAFCKEAIDRSMRYSMARNQGKPGQLTTSDLVAAAEGLRPQLEIMEGAHEGQEKSRLEETFSRLAREAVATLQVQDAHDGTVYYRLGEPADAERI